MLKSRDHIEILLLHRISYSIRKIGQITGHDRKSIHKILNAHKSQGMEIGVTPNGDAGQKPDTLVPTGIGRKQRGRRSTLEPYAVFLRNRIENEIIGSRQLLTELRQKGYEGSKRSVQRYLQSRHVRFSNGGGHMQEWMRFVLQGSINRAQLHADLGGKLSEEDTSVLAECVWYKPLKVRNRALAVLAHFKGASLREIATFLCVERTTARGYIAAFKTGGTTGVEQKSSRKEIKKAEDPKYVEAVFRILHTPPTACGYNRTTWRMDDLQACLGCAGLKIARVNIRAIIKNGGYKFRKARKVLTSNDPDYRQNSRRSPIFSAI